MIPFDIRSFLLVGAFLLSIGTFTVLSRRNGVAVLMGVELMLNGAGINFAAFAFFRGEPAGYAATLFIMALAACEVAVALAIIMAIYFMRRSVDINEPSELRG